MSNDGQRRVRIYWTFGRLSPLTARRRQIGFWIASKSVLGTLSDHPAMGRSRPELRYDVRSFPVGSYIIFYEVIPKGIDVIRILSGFMDIDADDML